MRRLIVGLIVVGAMVLISGAGAAFARAPSIVTGVEIAGGAGSSDTVNLRGSGRTQTIYYFAKEVKAGALDSIPAGKTIVENERTGLLFLKGK